jgi:tetratricopeptide (TPR) repeat protein
MWLVTSLCRRDATEAERALAAVPPQGVPIYSVSFPRPYYQALVYRLRGDEAQARAAFLSARAELEAELKKSPDYPNALAVLGLCDAALGQKEAAIREGLRAAELAPLQKNSLVGASVIKLLSLIYAWTGEKDLAFAELGRCARVPGGVTYGELKLDPAFDPVRGDPRFAEILGVLAPKEP